MLTHSHIVRRFVLGIAGIPTSRRYDKHGNIDIMTKDIVKPPARATRQQTPITQYKPQTPRTATPAVAPVVAAPPNKIGRPRKNLPVQAPPVQMKEVEVEVGQRIVIPPPPPPPAKDTTTRTLVITPPKFE